MVERATMRRMSTPAKAPRRDGGGGLRLLARIIFGLTILGIVAGIWLFFLDPRRQGSFILTISFILFPIVGYLLTTRRPDNSVSWLTLGVGAALGLSTFLEGFASYVIHTGTGGSHIGEIAASVDQPLWIPILVVPVTFLLLLFPEGHLTSPRWRWFAWVLGVGTVFVFLAILVSPGPLTESDFPDLQNALGTEGLRTFLSIAEVSIIILPIGVIGSLVSIAVFMEPSADWRPRRPTACARVTGSAPQSPANTTTLTVVKVR
jgi:hypothetical protein